MQNQTERIKDKAFFDMLHFLRYKRQVEDT
jgi:hypothetical protein